ncbi:MAG: hypothetical protein JJ913_10075 [Rhizobiaceae bacterium]|nr:hypothetical protein [Rhizobiaceae bacterium]
MTLEGVMGPNGRLDDAEGMSVDAPQALCVAGDGGLLFSSGNEVRQLSRWGAKAKKWAAFDSAVTAMCTSAGGLVAIGLRGGSVVVLGPDGKAASGWAETALQGHATDCAFASEDEIVAVHNGYVTDADFMSVAPWDDEARGQVISLSRDGVPKVVADKLHCPMGIARDAAGNWLVSLFERAAIIDIEGQTKQSGYPAYLGRIRRTAHGYVLACLARRDPLIEFLKTEREFVAEMKSAIAPRHWISPRASSEFSHDLPIEAGSTRLYGEVKPWAPSFSYGLVIELDDKLMPVGSAHSRANGTRHAISDVIEWNGAVIAVSRSSGELLKVGKAGAAA